MINNNLIYDLGFHIGQDSEFYLKKGFNVVAIEANPLLYEQGIKNFKEQINSGQLILMNIGIGYENKKMPFYINKKNSEWSSFNVEIGTSRGDYDIVEIETLTLDKIFIQYQLPYYLKIDLEGFDYSAVIALRNFLDKPKYLSIENGHPHIIEELYSQGYKKFKFINQAKIDKIVLKQPAKEGIYVEHKFPFSSSGPFGEETEGSWLSKEQVLLLSTQYWNNPNRDARIHGWYDLHAAF